MISIKNSNCKCNILKQTYRRNFLWGFAVFVFFCVVWYESEQSFLDRFFIVAIVNTLLYPLSVYVCGSSLQFILPPSFFSFIKSQPQSETRVMVLVNLFCWLFSLVFSVIAVIHFIYKKEG